MPSDQPLLNPVDFIAFWQGWEGQRIGGEFVLGRYLGGGADRAVFLTEFGQNQRAVVKLVMASTPGAELLPSRWAMASRLSHPHLARILAHGSGRWDTFDFFYVVTEYAEEQLSQVLVDRALTIAETREMLEPVLDALTYVHGQGFAHSHLRPANILAIDDVVKISSDNLCPCGEAYFAPLEQDPYAALETRSGLVSLEADIWSLGVVIAESLTQRRTALERLPSPFLEIAGLCLRMKPDERPTAIEVAQLLRQSTEAAPEPVGVGPPQRHLAWVFAFGLAAVAVLLGFLLFRGHPKSSNAPTAATVKPSAAPALPKTNAMAGKAVLERVLPDVPRRARDTIRGTVKIDVMINVDPAGRVVSVKLEPPENASYLGNLSLEAARRWKFRAGAPPQWRLRFQIRRTGTKVIEEPVSGRGGRNPETGK
jgi:TonB family protein